MDQYGEAEQAQKDAGFDEEINQLHEEEHEHIEKPVVRLSPSRKYFTLTDVTYEQTVAKPKKGTKKPTPQPNEGGGSNEDDGL